MRAVQRFVTNQRRHPERLQRRPEQTRREIEPTRFERDLSVGDLKDVQNLRLDTVVASLEAKRLLGPPVLDP